MNGSWRLSITTEDGKRINLIISADVSKIVPLIGKLADLDLRGYDDNGMEKTIMVRGTIKKIRRM